MSIIDTLRHKYALSQQGARDLVKSCLASAGMDIVLMLPVGLLFFLVKDLMEGNTLDTWSYVWKIALCLVAIAAMEFVKYNKQFTSVYLESGRRRIALAPCRSRSSAKKTSPTSPAPSWPTPPPLRRARRTGCRNS